MERERRRQLDRLRELDAASRHHGAGYPSQPDDVAVFEPSDANRTITINQSISIGELVITDNFNIFFTGNDNGRLVFDTSTRPGDR